MMTSPVHTFRQKLLRPTKIKIFEVNAYGGGGLSDIQSGI